MQKIISIIKKFNLIKFSLKFMKIKQINNINNKILKIIIIIIITITITILIMKIKNKE